MLQRPGGILHNPFDVVVSPLREHAQAADLLLGSVRGVIHR